MKYPSYIISLVSIITMQSCNAQCRTEQFERFKKELTEEAFDKYKKNEPAPFCDKIASSTRYYPYFESFGNSSICVLYDLKRTNNVLKKLKNLTSINKEEIKFIDSTYTYLYINPKTKEEITLPEIDSDLSEYCDVKSLVNKKTKIFILEKGTLESVFLEKESTKKTNFVSGIYYLQNESKIMYWVIYYL